MPDGEANNDPVARVAARVAMLQAEIEHLQAGIEQRTEELNHLQIYLSVHRKLFDTSIKVDQVGKAETALASSTKTAQTPKPKRAPRTSSPGIRQADVAPFVRTMILEHGRPMDQRKIFDNFKRKGCHVGGAPGTELKNLGKKIRRASAYIKHISGYGYWPIDVPCPEIGYVPS